MMPVNHRHRNIQVLFPNFEKIPPVAKIFGDNKHHSDHLLQKHLQIFSLGHYLFASRSRQSADKYPSIFLCQMAAIVYRVCVVLENLESPAILLWHFPGL